MTIYGHTFYDLNSVILWLISMNFAWSIKGWEENQGMADFDFFARYCRKYNVADTWAAKDLGLYINKNLTHWMELSTQLLSGNRAFLISRPELSWYEDSSGLPLLVITKIIWEEILFCHIKLLLNFNLCTLYLTSARIRFTDSERFSLIVKYIFCIINAHVQYNSLIHLWIILLHCNKLIHSSI